MDRNDSNSATNIPTRGIIHISIQLLALALLIGWCFRILDPFINPVIWGAILAVALAPLHGRLKNKLKGRSVLAAIIVTLSLFAILIVPAVWLAISTSDEIGNVITEYRQGNINIPVPPEKVKSWPVIGNKVDVLWRDASNGIDGLVKKYPEATRSIASTALNLLASTGKGLLMFALSIIICGVFLSYSRQAQDFANALFSRLLGNLKFNMSKIAAQTIRNVVKGILGVSFIQAALASIGFIVAGIPAPGIWALLCLVLSIIQVGVMPVSVGIIIYIWSTGTTLTATLLTIWMLIVGISDNILKPILLGKNAPVPMLVVFLGSLGGFMLSGFIGLFTGAVVLSLGYRLFEVWLRGAEA